MSCGGWTYTAMLWAIAFMGAAFVFILGNMFYRLSNIGKGGDK